jgi:hypothetical protein
MCMKLDMKLQDCCRRVLLTAEARDWERTNEIRLKCR